MKFLLDISVPFCVLNSPTRYNIITLFDESHEFLKQMINEIINSKEQLLSFNNQNNNGISILTDRSDDSKCCIFSIEKEFEPNKNDARILDDKTIEDFLKNTIENRSLEDLHFLDESLIKFMKSEDLNTFIKKYYEISVHRFNDRKKLEKLDENNNISSEDYEIRNIQCYIHFECIDNDYKIKASFELVHLLEHKDHPHQDIYSENESDKGEYYYNEFVRCFGNL